MMMMMMMMGVLVCVQTMEENGCRAAPQIRTTTTTTGEYPEVSVVEVMIGPTM